MNLQMITAYGCISETRRISVIWLIINQTIILYTSEVKENRLGRAMQTDVILDTQHDVPGLNN